MLTTFHWNALGSTLGWWFGPFGRRLGRCKSANSTRDTSGSASQHSHHIQCHKYGGPKKNGSAGSSPGDNWCYWSRIPRAIGNITSSPMSMQDGPSHDTPPPLVLPHPFVFPGGGWGTVTWSTQNLLFRLTVLSYKVTRRRPHCAWEDKERGGWSTLIRLSHICVHTQGIVCGSASQFDWF